MSILLPHFPPPEFPDKVWNGLTEHNINAYDRLAPDATDYSRLAIEIVAIQNQIDSLYYADESNLILKEPTFEDYAVPVQALKLSGTNPPVWTDYKGGQLLGFRDQAVAQNEEDVYFVMQLPHNRKPGSDIYPHVHWVIDSETEADVAWTFSYSISSIGDVFPSPTLDTKIGSTNGVADTHNITSFDVIDGSNIGLSAMFICTLKRKSSDPLDTLSSESALLLEFDIHYEVDRFGSKYEASY